jgi:gluconolactonase
MKRWTRLCSALFAFLDSVTVVAQNPGGTPFRIERLDPALDAIISPDAKLEELASGFALTEGPVWVGEGQQGYLLFSDNAGNVIYKYEPG